MAGIMDIDWTYRTCYNSLPNQTPLLSLILDEVLNLGQGMQVHALFKVRTHK